MIPPTANKEDITFHTKYTEKITPTAADKAEIAPPTTEKER